jgi:NAD(P)-dependent dehydrogenase (short-subunit alcohol dehydrogenase family)
MRCENAPPSLITVVRELSPARSVAYLASPEAGFITGISWNVDGGFAS